MHIKTPSILAYTWSLCSSQNQQIYISSIFHMNREIKQQIYIIMYESPKNVPEGENGNDIHYNSLMMFSVFP
jgi:hypothetical protein